MASRRVRIGEDLVRWLERHFQNSLPDHLKIFAGDRLFVELGIIQLMSQIENREYNITVNGKGEVLINEK